MKTLITVDSPAEADLIIAMLSNEGISVFNSQRHSGSYLMALGQPYRLDVADEDYFIASSILKDYLERMRPASPVRARAVGYRKEIMLFIVICGAVLFAAFTF